MPKDVPKQWDGSWDHKMTRLGGKATAEMPKTRRKAKRNPVARFPRTRRKARIKGHVLPLLIVVP